MEFFRHCPDCGRRFHIKLMDKSLVDTERTASGGSIGELSEGVAAVHVKGAPMIFDIEEFRYEYKCRHCGHEWSEKRLRSHREA
jgi:DNA-directed RNA polymerase subunit RPC12/RpoP